MSAPNLKEIEWAISELERQESSSRNYILLAALYTCRKQMSGGATQKPQAAPYSSAISSAPDILDLYGNSDFLQTVFGKESFAAWTVMDELMETLKIVNQRAYDSVIQKLKKL